MRNKILIMVLILLISILVASAQDCENSALDPGEYCYGSTFFEDIDCIDLYGPDWEGSVSCRTPDQDNPCQPDVVACEQIEDEEEEYGDECIDCDDWDDDWDNAENVCNEVCAGGNCYYEESSVTSLLDSCEDCEDVTSCDDYDNVASCSGGGTDACHLLANGIIGFPCEWVSTGGYCTENQDCQWNCDDVYGDCVNGFKSNTNNLCDLVSGDSVECSLNNPAYNFPDELGCGYELLNFPVFTGFNILMVSILLIGYYLVRKERWRRKD